MPALPAGPPAPARRLLSLAIWFAAAVLAATPLLPFLAWNGTPAAGRILVAVLLGVAAWRPSLALLLFAGLAPVSPAWTVLIHTPPRVIEPLLLALLTGWILHEARGAVHGRRMPAVPALVPALLLLLAVVASGVVQLEVARAWRPASPPGLGTELWRSLTGYLTGAPVLQAVTNCTVLLESLGLFALVAVLVRRDASLAPRLTRMLVIGVTAVAVLNVNRFVEVVLRTGEPLATAVAARLAGTRVSALFPDVNAAGSYFALVVPFSLALALRAGKRAWFWLATSSCLLAALWLTGSRAAVLAVPAAGILVFGSMLYAQDRPQRTRVAFLLVTGAVLIAITTFAFYGPALRKTPIAAAFDFRVGLAAAAVRMVAAFPTFGVGLGRFQVFAYQFSNPEVQFHIGSENAHNNFLQIAAELGLVGLALFLAVLVLVCRPLGRRLSQRDGACDRLASLWGITAFAITCLAGHPLLILDVSLVFWLVLGLAAGLDAEEAREARAFVPARWAIGRRAVAAIGVAFLLTTLPYRMVHALDREDLEHAASGFGDWQASSEGRPFRELTGEGRLFVPSAARVVRLPVRLPAADNPSVQVRVELDGRFVNQLRVESTDWQWIELLLPPQRDDRLFLPVRLMVNRSEPAVRRVMATSERQDGGATGVQVGRPWYLVPPARRFPLRRQLL